MDALDSPAAETHRGEAPISEGPAAARETADDPIRRRDLLLVEQARGGDLEAFNRLVEAHQDGLFGLVVRLVRDVDTAHDVVQEAVFSAYRNLGSFRGGSVKSWLARIAVNAAMDAGRARRRRPTVAYPELEDETWQPPSDEQSDPEWLAVAGERGAVLAAALAAIGGDQRTAIVLYDVEGYDYGEIAAMTGVSVGTVKSRIHRGRLALRELLADRRELLRG